MKLRGPIAQGTIRTSAVLALRLGIQAGTLLVVARLLGPQGYGAFAGISALAVTMGSLSSFGMHLVILGKVAQEPGSCNDLMSRAIPVTLSCGTLLLALFIVLGTAALHEADVPLSVILAIGVAEILLQPFSNLAAHRLLAQGHTAKSQMLTVLPLLLRLLAAGAVALLSPADRLRPYAFSYLGASTVTLLFVTLALSERWPPPRQWRWPRKAEWKEAAGYAALTTTATGPAELDKILATKILTLSDSGLYSAGQRVIGAATLPVVAMLLAAMPRLFREAQARQDTTIALYRLILVTAATYGVLLSCVLWTAAPGLSWLFGPRYAGMEHVLRWLAFAVPGLSIRTAAASMLMTFGKPWMRVLLEATGIAVLAISALVLVERLGLTGMPLALIISEWAMAMLGSALLIDSVRRNKTNSPRKGMHGKRR